MPISGQLFPAGSYSPSAAGAIDSLAWPEACAVTPFGAEEQSPQGGGPIYLPIMLKNGE